MSGMVWCGGEIFLRIRRVWMGKNRRRAMMQRRGHVPPIDSGVGRQMVGVFLVLMLQVELVLLVRRVGGTHTGMRAHNHGMVVIILTHAWFLLLLLLLLLLVSSVCASRVSLFQAPTPLNCWSVFTSVWIHKKKILS